VGVGVCVGDGAVVEDAIGLGSVVGVPVAHRLTRNPVAAAAVARRKSRLDIGRCCEVDFSVVFLEPCCFFIVLGHFLSTCAIQAKQPPRIVGGRICERTHLYGFDVCDALGNVRKVGRFVPLSPVGGRG